MNTELKESCIQQLRKKIKPLNWYLPYAQLEEKIISAMIDFHKQELSRLGEIYVAVSVEKELPTVSDWYFVWKQNENGSIRKVDTIWFDADNKTFEFFEPTHWLKKLSLEEKIIEPAAEQPSEPVVSLTSSSGNSVEQIKQLPEVMALDSKINTCVHNELYNQHYKEIQHKFWDAIDAIQLLLNKEPNDKRSVASKDPQGDDAGI